MLPSLIIAILVSSQVYSKCEGNDLTKYKGILSTKIIAHIPNASGKTIDIINCEVKAPSTTLELSFSGKTCKIVYTTANEAKRSLAALASCEAHAGHIAARRRNLDYRRCATEPLARTHAFASANSRMLSNLAGSTNPVRACRGRVPAGRRTPATLASPSPAPRATPAAPCC